MPPKGTRKNQKTAPEQATESPAKKAKGNCEESAAADAQARHDLQKQLSSALKYKSKNETPEQLQAKAEALTNTSVVCNIVST